MSRGSGEGGCIAVLSGFVLLGAVYAVGAYLWEDEPELLAALVAVVALLFGAAHRNDRRRARETRAERARLEAMPPEEREQEAAALRERVVAEAAAEQRARKELEQQARVAVEEQIALAGLGALNTFSVYRVKLESGRVEGVAGTTRTPRVEFSVHVPKDLDLGIHVSLYG